MNWLLLGFAAIRDWFLDRGELVTENLAYRQQLATYKHKKKRPRLRLTDRFFWIVLSRVWSKWEDALSIVQPATVVRWHRQGFKLYWRWKSRSKEPGRPKIDAEIRRLIRQMSGENPTWGAPRIQSELALLEYDVSEATVAKYMVRSGKPPSQTWRTFLANHAADLVAIDFFTVPTATFRVVFIFIMLGHERRRVVHFDVTEHPSAEWTGQQIVNAFPYEEAPRFLLRDNDGIYGKAFHERVDSLEIDEVPTAKRSPWQNPYCERLIGSIRRECLDHVIILNEVHLKRILTSYFEYYHTARAHLSLNRNAPIPREIEPRDHGTVVSIPMVGRLHHRYGRRAA